MESVPALVGSYTLAQTLTAYGQFTQWHRGVWRGVHLTCEAVREDKHLLCPYRIPFIIDRKLMIWDQNYNFPNCLEMYAVNVQIIP